MYYELQKHVRMIYRNRYLWTTETSKYDLQK